ncbi:SGNH/GDSL hydrolase family protein [Chitinivorax sp. B]|uniref:SGNH/GDSL hydrolase family protein n=1 Tax=Chitinivorax sp. B TaxID=2502235 RepID=UPI0010F97A74|nr:SGNH/GDSL hydrolase family protein [Chitinivorax sp. B]
MRQLLIAAVLSVLPAASWAGVPIDDAQYPRAKQARSVNTYTYLRCWYPISDNPLQPKASYEWARDPVSGDWFRVYGNWWAGGALRWQNMFYSNTSQQTLQSVCRQTLEKKGIQRPVISTFAADNATSFNYTIWTNDSAAQGNTLNKVISFGDSLSDTQNAYNASLWQLPNTSWMGGRFSNGRVWAEYLSQSLNLPFYNWAFGGSATDQQTVVPGLVQQVKSWREYMREASDYHPENTLFTVLSGGNDLVNYGRSPTQAIASIREALINLIDGGARHILLLNLPDVSRAPVFKFRQNGAQVAVDVQNYNQRLNELADEMRARYGSSLQLKLFNTNSMFDDLLNNPAQYGISNIKDSCLDIRKSSPLVYLQPQKVHSDCRDPNQYVFWDALHPTTRTHQLMASKVDGFVRQHFPNLPR